MSCYSDYSGNHTKLKKILLNGNNICMASLFPYFISVANSRVVNTWWRGSSCCSFGIIGEPRGHYGYCRARELGTGVSIISLRMHQSMDQFKGIERIGFCKIYLCALLILPSALSCKCSSEESSSHRFLVVRSIEWNALPAEAHEALLFSLEAI